MMVWAGSWDLTPHSVFPVGKIEGLEEANIRSQLDRIEQLVREVLEKLSTHREG